MPYDATPSLCFGINTGKGVTVGAARLGMSVVVNGVKLSKPRHHSSEYAEQQKMDSFLLSSFFFLLSSFPAMLLSVSVCRSAEGGPRSVTRAEPGSCPLVSLSFVPSSRLLRCLRKAKQTLSAARARYLGASLCCEDCLSSLLTTTHHLVVNSPPACQLSVSKALQQAVASCTQPGNDGIGLGLEPRAHEVTVVVVNSQLGESSR